MSDVKASDMKLNRVRVQVDPRNRPERFLFGRLVNEFGFLTDSGRVVAITPHMEVRHA